ncbi:MAG: glycosyltransferase [Acidobacteriia bacterium]|nr:glycosyltransferase [Terriglobia bacterium]
MSLSILSIAYPLAPAGPDAVGGAEQILSVLDRALVADGHRSVVIACEGSQAEGVLLPAPLPTGHWDEDARRAVHERYRRLIAQALDRWRFDAVHMHSLDFHCYLPPPGVPVLVTLHLPPGWYPEQIFRASRPGTWLQCVSASQLLCCPPGAVMPSFIENGVPVERFPAAARKRNFALTLGRICPEKGFHLALDAGTRADVPVVLAGETFPYPEHQDYFRNEISPRLGGPGHRFVGPVAFARKRRLLSAARCLLVPSLAPETSSLVAMEALASGTPVIAFPAGALPEIVEHGRTGFLVRDVREMADAIRMIGNLDPEECRYAARTRFSARRMIGEYFDLYQKLAQTAHVEEPAHFVP